MTRTVWYPGHMARGLRKLRELSEKLDRVQTERDADRDVDLDRGQ